MNTIWYRVSRLLHPITLAVILVGIAGFLLGLIVAVERQDAAVVNAEASSRIARLETALAGRGSEVAELQAELAAQRTEAPSSGAAAEAESRIAGVEAALLDKSTALNVVQSELDALSGQLAEAIQTRDDLRKELEQAAQDRDGLRQELEQAVQYLDAQRKKSEQVSRDSDNERAGLEQTVADLRRELEAAQGRARAPVPEVAAREESPPTAAPAEEPQQAAAETTAPEPPAATPAKPAKTARAEPREPKQLSPPAPAPSGPISQGIVAYRAADYRKAYALWLPPALKGSPRAQFFIGALYYEGRGVPADRVQSYMWLRAATRKDDPGAIKLLDKLRGGMSGPELAEAETRIANGEIVPPR